MNCKYTSIHFPGIAAEYSINTSFASKTNLGYQISASTQHLNSQPNPVEDGNKAYYFRRCRLHRQWKYPHNLHGTKPQF